MNLRYMMFVSLMFLFLSTHGLAQIRIAVATNFKPTLTALIESYIEYRAEHNLAPVDISLSSSSTGILFAQISHGAPYDILFSADSDSVEQLKQTLKLPEQAAFVYALGRLVFLCREDAPDSVQTMVGWHGSYGQANEKLAPYGLAASQVVKTLNWQENKVIKSTSVAQVSHFIASGALDCGFTAKSLLPDNLADNRYFEIPAHLHDPIIQKALVLTKDSAKKMEADEFARFVLKQGREIILNAGYVIDL